MQSIRELKTLEEYSPRRQADALASASGLGRGIDVGGLNLPKNIMVNKQLRGSHDSAEYHRHLRNYQKKLTSD